MTRALLLGFVVVGVALALARRRREGEVRYFFDEEGHWYSDGDHTEPTPKEWK